MHPPRLNRIPQNPPSGVADRLVEWLVRHCPFSTLTVLFLLVLSPLTGPVPNPPLVAVSVVIADLALYAMRRWVS